MQTINATGNGPGPEAAVKEAVGRGAAELEVLMDNPVYASGVMRFLESKGFDVQLLDDEGTITVSARKSGKSPSDEAPPARPAANKPRPAQAIAGQQTAARRKEPSEGGCFVLITRSALGAGTELGETLMKNFLCSLAQAERPPFAVALMNDGVKLSRYDSSFCDHLKNLERKGVLVLISGTCANYFSIMDEVGAGSISGMDEIVEIISRADKVITL